MRLTKIIIPILIANMYLCGCNNINKTNVMIMSGHVQNPFGHNSQGILSSTNIPENKYNDDISNLFELQKNNSINYIVHQSSENIGLKQKVEVANFNNLDLYIEIHHDSAQEKDILEAKKKGSDSLEWEKIEGFSIHLNSKHPEFSKSLEFAEYLSNNLLKAGFKPNLYHTDVEGMICIDRNRGLYDRQSPHSLYVLKNIKSPAILYEVGSIVSPNENSFLSKTETKKIIKKSIEKAIKKYAKNHK